MPLPGEANSEREAQAENRLVFLALLVAIGTVLHVTENFFVAIVPIPGAKLGLANIVTVLALRQYGLRDGLLVAILRVLIGSFLSGLFLSPGFFLGLSGAISSTVFMSFLLNFRNIFSMIGVSVGGAVGHNTGQLLAACLLLQTHAVVYYLPVLLLLAIPTGMITGYLLNGFFKNGGDFSPPKHEGGLSKNL